MLAAAGIIIPEGLQVQAVLSTAMLVCTQPCVRQLGLFLECYHAVLIIATQTHEQYDCIALLNSCGSAIQDEASALIQLVFSMRTPNESPAM